MRKKDLTNQIFGKLKVISFAYSDSLRNYWNCVCDCGVNKIFSTLSIKRRNSCGCLKKNYFHNMVGQSYNGLDIVTFIGQNNYKSYLYEIKCICGNLFVSEGNDIKQGKIKSCGCRINSLQQQKKNPILRLKNKLYSDYRNKASKRNLDFDLEKEDFFNFIDKNCFYCNSGLLNTQKDNTKEGTVLRYNGIDRTDNYNGYNKENCVTCCRICNQAKHLLSIEEFKRWLERIFDTKNKKIGFWANGQT